MTVPIGVPDCPRGLEYLCTLDQLLVKQKHSLTEAMLGFEANNKYIIKNCLGQNVSEMTHFHRTLFINMVLSHSHFRFIWPLKIRIVVHEIAVAIADHLI